MFWSWHHQLMYLCKQQRHLLTRKYSFKFEPEFTQKKLQSKPQGFLKNTNKILKITHMPPIVTDTVL